MRAIVVHDNNSPISSNQRNMVSTNKDSGYITLREETIASIGPYDINVSYRKNKRTDAVIDFLHIDTNNWAVIFALTEDDHFIFVRQYRNAIEQFCTEPPGGILEEHEDPAQGVARELIEETGYQASSIEFIGTVRPNPAMYMNHISYYFARDAKKVQEITLDDGENLELLLVERNKAISMLMTGSGEFVHGLHVAGMGMLLHKHPTLLLNK